jgi:hypothetical protein
MDGAAFGGLFLAGVVGSGVRLATFGRLFARSPVWSRGFVASTVTGALGFAAQVPAFALGSHLLSGSDASLGSELRSATLAMGGLGIVGWSGAWLSRRLGLNGGWGGAFFHQGGILGGVYLGRWLEEVTDPKPRSGDSTILLDSLALFFNYHVVGRLMPDAWARPFQAREAALHRSAVSAGGERGYSFSFAFPSVSSAGVRGRPDTLSGPPNSTLQPLFHPMVIHSPPSGSTSQPPAGSIAPTSTSGASVAKPSAREIPTLRVGIIGGGMAGLFSALTLTHRLAEIVEGANYFRTAVTLLTANLGGKVRPNNEGAQFIDASHSFPLIPWIHELGIETFVRPDYDLADLILPSGPRLGGRHFIDKLDSHRAAARRTLQNSSWDDLDGVPAKAFLGLLKHSTLLTKHEDEAFRVRVGVEEGVNVFSETANLSALAYALNMAKSKTPMPRLEVVGGPYRMVEILGAKLREAGADLRESSRVREIQVLKTGVRVLFEQGEKANPLEEMFDAAILAVSPEQLNGIKIEFANPTSLPIDLLKALPTTRITKTNVVIEHRGEIPEVVTPRLASWESPLPDKPKGLKMISFFHGMNGEAPLKLDQLIRVFQENRPKVCSSWSRTWDAAAVSAPALPDGYTTLPGVGQGLPLARAVYRHYLSNQDFGPLWLANHTMGLGCYMHNAALSGFLAARALARSRGALVKPFDEWQLFGVDLSEGVLSQLK